MLMWSYYFLLCQDCNGCLLPVSRGLVRLQPERPGTRPVPAGSAWPDSKSGLTWNSCSVRPGPGRKPARFCSSPVGNGLEWSQESYPPAPIRLHARGRRRRHNWWCARRRLGGARRLRGFTAAAR